MLFVRKHFSKKRARKLLRQKETLLRRRRKRLTPEALKEVEAALDDLKNTLKNKQETELAVERVNRVCAQYLHKTSWDYIRDTLVGIVIALVLAIVVRQMWFEPMEIPSGSMRPTFRELDRLIVSKDTFGLNIPLLPAHFLFEPHLIPRGGIVIFTSENMDISDQDTFYFGLPGKKRLVKRAVGLPGDLLYFYGGEIWGIDAQGNAIDPRSEFAHVPFIEIEGKVDITSTVALFKQMNQVLGRLNFSSNTLRGEIFNGATWIPDSPYLADDKELHTYSDFYGNRNFAMARLLTSAQLAKISQAPLDNLEEGVLYLEMRHHASLSFPKPLIVRDMWGALVPLLRPEVSVIPLRQEHLDRIMQAMSTSRFIVKGGRAYPVLEGQKDLPTSPYRAYFPGVPDGRYEFIKGTAYSVDFGGILKKLSPDHPLLKNTPENIQLLFNLGVEVLNPFAPQARDQRFFPNRYAYFRDGSLYLLDRPLFAKEDPLLNAFNAQEEKRAASSTPQQPYLPFKDYGPPLTETGELDLDFLKTFGLQIPPNNYLALGDNYASSGDSRLFGFVPGENLQGTPSTLLWPPGKRWGTSALPHYPLFTLPRMIIWGLVLIILLIYIVWRRAIRR
ncbi:MAG: signal peptidase I [Verrucomicrobia bacterium]|nr:signal peptidase I [Verrucomicrobiota bacterium]